MRRNHRKRPRPAPATRANRARPRPTRPDSQDPLAALPPRRRRTAGLLLDLLRRRGALTLSQSVYMGLDLVADLSELQARLAAGDLGALGLVSVEESRGATVVRLLPAAGRP
jgi:hypothetical protein